MKRKVMVVTVCAGAVCRSVAMALFLKGEGIDALALSFDWNTPATFSMLSKWADRIVVMEAKYAAKIPAKYTGKVRVCDVGPDRWRNPLHEELLGKCHAWFTAGGMAEPAPTEEKVTK